MNKPKAKDENDRLRDGTLPADPGDDAAPSLDALPDRAAIVRLVDAGMAGSATPMPQDVHAEAALIGMLLWAGANAPDRLPVSVVADLVEGPEQFFTEPHALIFAAILELAKTKKVCDAVSVHSELARRHKERAAGGVEYIDKLVALTTACSEAKARGYAQSIRDTWLRRAIAHLAVQLDAASRGGKTTAAELVAAATEKLRTIGERISVSAGVVPISTTVAIVIDELNKPKKLCLPTGIRDLDQAIGGFFPNETTILGARTSVGKSAMAAQIAFNIEAADPKVAILYVTMEMPGENFTRRILATRANVDGRKIRHNELSGAEKVRIMAAADELKRKNVFFMQSQTQTLMTIYTAASQKAEQLARAGKRLGLVVIDHLGLVKPSSRGLEKKRHEQVAETSRGLRHIAEHVGCHVLALAQIKRDAEQRKGADRMPKLFDLKESGAIEDDADSVLLLHRERDEHGMFLKEQPAWVSVAKSRNDDLSLFKLGFEGWRMRFIDWNGE